MGDTFAAAVVGKYSRNDFANEEQHESVSSLALFENKAKECLPESQETNL